MKTAGLSWLGIARLGLVQMALGSIIALTTSTLNRVMVVELALPAILPGALVGLHYAVQILRPRLGYGSDVGGRRTPWIVGGMIVLAVGGAGAALATAWMTLNTTAGIVAAVLAFFLIGLGVGASGTALLTMLATMTAPRRRPAAATIVWLMMIAGIAVTATVAGGLLDPFSPLRLVMVTASVSLVAVILAIAATFRVEPAAPVRATDHAETRPDFRKALIEVWSEPAARRFTIFVFVSMLAYSAQDLILEPFAGIVFGMSPGESTKLAGIQHAGVLGGMLLVAIAGSAFKIGTMRGWVIIGCIASALALAGLASSGFAGPGFSIKPMVFLLGLANGAFAVAAIGSMMTLAAAGRERREGTRMGLWGAAQAIAFGLGGFLGTVAIDITRAILPTPELAYGTVFGLEACLFVASAMLATRIAIVPAPALHPWGQTATQSPA